MQAAIDDAQRTAQAVLIPAGVYALRAPLLGHCSNSKLQPGEPLIGHKDTCGSDAVWPDVGHPLRIIGEGIGLTVLVAAAPIPAVLHWRSNNNKTNPDIFSDQNSIEHLSIAGNCSTNATSNTCSGKSNQQSSSAIGKRPSLGCTGGAQVGVLGASIIHSRVVSVHVSGCGATGIRLTNSFCDQVENCRIEDNGIGVEFKGSANNVDIVRAVSSLRLLSEASKNRRHR